jgi:hypothetical protein
MVRTALLSAVAALGLTVTAGSVDAHPPVVTYRHLHTAYYPRPPVCRTWEVMYRNCPAEAWRCYGTFESQYRADRAARHLRHRGIEVFVSVGG